jgi:hypothetical protein
MQEVLYVSIEYEETEEHFIEHAKNVMNKIFEEYDVSAIKNYVEKDIPRYMISRSKFFIYTNCIYI